jgi:hypothetical protein
MFVLRETLLAANCPSRAIVPAIDALSSDGRESNFEAYEEHTTRRLGADSPISKLIKFQKFERSEGPVSAPHHPGEGAGGGARAIRCGTLD